MQYLKLFKTKPPSYSYFCSLLQLLVAILFLHYFYQETNHFYCFFTGRKGLYYITEDGFKLMIISHKETTEMEWGGYLYQLASIMWKKIFVKLNQHFIISTTTFAQKSLLKYTENLFEICSPNFKYHTQSQYNGWYGYIEPMIRLFVHPTEMSYCFLDSNRLFNSYLSMEIEKYILQFKVNLITMTSTGLISITMGYRAVMHLWVEHTNPKPPMFLEIYPEFPTETEMVAKPRRKTKKEK